MSGRAPWFSALRGVRWNGLWRRGAGTPDDPDNGRLIFRVTGIGAYLYARRCDNRAAMFRTLYWWIIRRYKTELCQHCGRPVRLVYHQCLSKLAKEAGLPFLRWTCSTDDSVMVG